MSQPPFTPAEAPEIIGTAVNFHYLNRMVNILLIRTNLPRNPLVKGAMKRTFGWLYRRSARKTHPPGVALALLQAAPLPTDLAWAEPATGKLVREFRGHKGSVNAVAFAPDGGAVASAGEDGTVLVWRVPGAR